MYSRLSQSTVCSPF